MCLGEQYLVLLDEKIIQLVGKHNYPWPYSLPEEQRQHELPGTQALAPGEPRFQPRTRIGLEVASELLFQLQLVSKAQFDVVWRAP